MNTDAYTQTPAAAFDIGRVVSTPKAMQTFTRPELLHALQRHIATDWIEMDPEDQDTNRQATHNGARILSAYKYNSERLWIITEAEDDLGIRAVTTFLLPCEY